MICVAVLVGDDPGLAVDPLRTMHLCVRESSFSRATTASGGVVRSTSRSWRVAPGLRDSFPDLPVQIGAYSLRMGSLAMPVCLSSDMRDLVGLYQDARGWAPSY